MAERMSKLRKLSRGSFYNEYNTILGLLTGALAALSHMLDTLLVMAPT